MTNNNEDPNPNSHPSTSKAIIPTYPNPNLQLSLSSSYQQTPTKKRKRTTKTIASSSSTTSSPKPKHTNEKLDLVASNVTHPCTECNKQFSSLKALFGHMRCHPERQWRGINPPPDHRGGLTGVASSSRQRSSTKSVSCKSEECAVVTALLMLSGNQSPSSSGEKFECGVCKKVFASHQALGGHRASHKNVKGCFAITNVSNDDPMNVATTSSAQDHQGVTLSGNHKCNVCYRVFPSGQALGGHMRCHWEKEEERVVIGGGLDLNVPPTTTMHDASTSDKSGCSLDLTLRL